MSVSETVSPRTVRHDTDNVSTVVLKNGLSVPLAALRVLWSLEERGLHVQLDDDDGLFVGPRRQLTSADRDAIRAHRDDLRQLVRYCEGIT